MERLTHERVNGIKTGYWSAATKEVLVQKLAAYENTGYEPDEIRAAIEQAAKNSETKTATIMAECIAGAMKDTLEKYGISHSVELDTENSDDKAGSPATKTKALKLQSMSFDFDLAAAVGCDVRSEYESWTALVGQYAPFYLAGRRFGPANLQLTAVSLSDTKLDNLGRILTGKITIKLTEYAEEASSKKASSGTSSSSGKSGSSSKSAAGIATYKELGISSSAVSVGASSSAKASKKPTNAQLK